MINTIFYFVDSLSFNDYTSQIRSGDISKKTIVFVDDTSSIFMGGKSYSYNDSALRDEINHIQETIATLRENIEETISEINTDVQEVSELAQAQKDRLDTLLADLDDSIKDRIEQLFDDAQWIQQNFPQGVINWQSGWDDQIEAYLSRVGVWSRDNDVTKTQWSNLIQSVNTLEGSVSSLTSTTNGLVTVSEGLDSRINLAINGKIAELNLGTTYAKINDVKGILEWMYSGLKSASSSSLSYNDLVTAAKNDQLGISAISEIRTSIENLGDTYAAKTEMNTLVNDSLASLIQAVDANQTLTGIINQLGTNTSNISSITSRVQAIEGAGYISQSQMLNALENELDGTTTTSSVKSKVDSVAKTAAATLFSGVSDAQDNITAASIVNAITNDTNASTSLSSYFNSGLTQNQVETIVNTTLDASATGGSWSTWVSSMENGTVKKAEIIASVNNSTESNVKISADKINIDGYLTGGSASFKGDVEATTFIAGDSSGINITTTANTISFNDGNTPKAYFTAENGGFQLYMYDGTDWRKIDFASMLNTTGGSSPSNSCSIIKFTIGNANYTSSTLYYSNFTHCYIDYGGQTYATNSNTDGYYIPLTSVLDYISSSVISGIAELDPSYSNPDVTYNRGVLANYTIYTDPDSNKITKGGKAFIPYIPISFGNDGQLILDSNISNWIFKGMVTSEYITCNTLQTVNAEDIYNSASTPLSMTNWSGTHDSTYSLYVGTISSTAAQVGHFSQIVPVSNHWTAENH